jgi:hypothetical protein
VNADERARLRTVVNNICDGTKTAVIVVPYAKYLAPRGTTFAWSTWLQVGRRSRVVCAPANTGLEPTARSLRTAPRLSPKRSQAGGRGKLTPPRPNGLRGAKLIACRRFIARVRIGLLLLSGSARITACPYRARSKPGEVLAGSSAIGSQRRLWCGGTGTARAARR